jgi:hypothetical protein
MRWFCELLARVFRRRNAAAIDYPILKARAKAAHDAALVRAGLKCQDCGTELLFSARKRGLYLCGPCMRQRAAAITEEYKVCFEHREEAARTLGEAPGENFDRVCWKCGGVVVTTDEFAPALCARCLSEED